ncbi:uncharacterized protein LOC143280320 [Babylonia areolata]|uniref:uncharacterized protein LOC143280320 n=1 Tax=Babylonia areolata TaxID=304850 RepID=UPI003FD13D9C
MLTEGEPPEKAPRISAFTAASSTTTPPPPLPSHHHPHSHPHPLPDTTVGTGGEASSSSSSSHDPESFHLNENHEGGGGRPSAATTGVHTPTACAPDMPAFPERGGPPPLASADQMRAREQGVDMDYPTGSPEGGHSSGSGDGGRMGEKSNYGRRQREFIPEEKKDEQYWEKRRKNNEAARRSREKRRLHDMVLENRIVSLEQDNMRLRSELSCLKKHFGLPLDRPFMEQDRPDSLRASPSPPPVPPPSTSGGSMKGSNGGGGMNAAGLAPFSEPPPLLAVTPNSLPVTLQQATLPAVFPPQAAPMAYFLSGGNPNDLHVPRAKPDSQAPPLLHAHSNLIVKHETEEERELVIAAQSQDCGYGEEGTRDGLYPNYGPGPCPSPSAMGGLSASATAAAAAAQFAAASGGRDFSSRPNHYDHYPPRSWQRSPISSHSSDDASDEPLQLTVNKRSSEDDSRDDIDSGREGGMGGLGGDSNSSSRHSNGAGSPPQTSMPLKLRHKMPSELSPPHHPGYPGGPLGMTGTPFVGLTQLSEIALAQASPLSLVKKDSSGTAAVRGSAGRNPPSDPRHLDPKYVERRRRNNEAARKCRENRKNLTRLREAKSEYLESENNKLRVELESLQEEMKQLRELLDKKRLEQGLSQEALQQQTAFSEEQMKRLEQLEQEHRLLEQEQQRLEKKREQHQNDMLNNDYGDLDDHHKDLD